MRVLVLGRFVSRVVGFWGFCGLLSFWGFWVLAVGPRVLGSQVSSASPTDQAPGKWVFS